MTSDLVVTLCGDARDKCPVTPATIEKQHWPLPDPAAAVGTPEAVRNVFRQVRDEIERRVQQLNRSK